MADINIPAGQIPQQANISSTPTQATTTAQTQATTTATQPQSLQLPSTTIIPGLAKDINVGDTINFVMRGRSPDGLGLLYMFGQLVKASVPDHINTGDKVQAKIEKQGDKVLFKILGINSKLPDQNIPTEQILQKLSISLPEKIERQVSSLLLKLAPYLPDQSLQTHAPIKDLTTNINNIASSNNKELLQILTDLKKLFSTDSALTNSAQLINQLKQNITPETLLKSHDLLGKIQKFIESQTGQPELRFFGKILDELKNISKSLGDKPSSEALTKAFNDIEKLVKVLTHEAETESLGKTTKKNFQYFDSVKIIRSELNQILSDKSQLTEANLNKIENLLSKLQPEAKTFQSNQAISTDSLRDLYNLASAMEQFNTVAALMSQLEPIMGMMQAPELILFPFIFQGFMSFAEVAIDPNAHKKNNQGKQQGNKEDTEEDPKEGIKKSKNPMYRYTTSLQLPNLGFVSVSSLHEDKKIDIKINVEDQEKSKFIMSKMEDLKTELASSGVSIRDFYTEAIDISEKILIVPSGE